VNSLQAQGRLYVADAAYSSKKATMDAKTAKAKQLIAEAEMLQAASEAVIAEDLESAPG